MKGLTPSGLEHARKLLADCVLFRKLTPNERSALVARAHMRAFQAGDTIFLMGAQHDSMLAVLSGEVKISMTSSEGREIVLAIRPPGEVFGEIAMLDGKPRSADAKALTDCNLAVLERRDAQSCRLARAGRGIVLTPAPHRSPPGRVRPVGLACAAREGAAARDRARRRRDAEGRRPQLSADAA